VSLLDKMSATSGVKHTHLKAIGLSEHSAFHDYPLHFENEPPLQDISPYAAVAPLPSLTPNADDEYKQNVISAPTPIADGDMRRVIAEPAKTICPQKICRHRGTVLMKAKSVEVSDIICSS
jgi:hypothetical protein